MIAWSDLAAGAEALGDPPLAAAHRARARRFHDALMNAKRAHAVPLAVVEEL